MERQTLKLTELSLKQSEVTGQLLYTPGNMHSLFSPFGSHPHRSRSHTLTITRGTPCKPRAPEVVPGLICSGVEVVSVAQLHWMWSCLIKLLGEGGQIVSERVLAKFIFLRTRVGNTSDLPNLLSGRVGSSGEEMEAQGG